MVEEERVVVEKVVRSESKFIPCIHPLTMIREASRAKE